MVKKLKYFFDNLNKNIKAILRKEKEKVLKNLTSEIPSLLWKSVKFPLLSFVGFGYCLMVFNREVNTKYKYVCFDVKECKNKINKIEKKKNKQKVKKEEKLESSFFYTDKLKRIFTKNL